MSDGSAETKEDGKQQNLDSHDREGLKSSVEHLYQYERDTADFAREFEENMVRF